jgi:NADP-dependent 3-hydroxy acid dehydrogenase YdfG
MLLQILQELLALNRETRVVALLRGAHRAGAAEAMGKGLVGSVVLGFMRTVVLEAPRLHPQTIDVADLSPDEVAKLVADELKASPQDMDADVSYVGNERRIPRLTTTDSPPDAPALNRPEGTYLITGGLGALGLLSAQTLVEMGAQSIVLLSRSGKVAGGDETLQTIYDELQASGATVNSWLCDVSNAKEVNAVVERIEKELPENALRGVVHSAGLLDVVSIPDQTPAKFMSSVKPKVAGAWHLHKKTQAMDLDTFMVFSSISTHIGLSRAASYSASCSYLDSLVAWRRSLGLKACSVQWGPVADVGMNTRESFGSKTLRPVPPKAMQAAFRHMLSVESPLPS